MGLGRKVDALTFNRLILFRLFRLLRLLFEVAELLDVEVLMPLGAGVPFVTEVIVVVVAFLPLNGGMAWMNMLIGLDAVDFPTMSVDVLGFVGGTGFCTVEAGGAIWFASGALVRGGATIIFL